MRKILSLFVSLMLICTVAFVLTGCGDDNYNLKEKTRTVVDMNSNTIELPETIDGYIDIWYSHQGIMAMLDKNCEKMVGTNFTKDNESCAWFFEIYPNVAIKPSIQETMSVEAVLELNVDVVFWQNNKSSDLVAQLSELGIPCVNINFTDYESMKKSITLVAEVLNTDYARNIANKFNTKLDEVINHVSSVISKIPQEERVRVLNLRSFETLRADALGTIGNAWIELCGGYNVIAETGLEGNQYLNIEQIFDWDPDFVISGVTGDADWAYAQTDLASLSCIKNKHLYDNPAGIFTWGRGTTESLLQIEWAAKTFYPELFSDIDMNNSIKNFYKDFYNYDISDENIQQILKALSPVGWKPEN